MKKFECNGCFKGPCYFEMQKGVTGKPVGCLIINSQMPELKKLPEKIRDRINIDKPPKPYWDRVYY
jgi:hypothetical protein